MRDRILNPEKVAVKGQYVVAKRSQFAIKKTFNSVGVKTNYASNNISALSFMGKNSQGARQQLLSIYTNNIKILSSDAFNGATTLAKVSLNAEITEIGSRCFNNCANLLSIEIPHSTTIIHDNAFSNCGQLNDVQFEFWEYDTSSAVRPTINFIDYYAFENSNKLTQITFPNTLNSNKCFDQNALYRSNLSSITLLGIHSTNINVINTTKCFGLRKDCSIFTSNGKKYVYSNESNTVTEDTSYKKYQNAKISQGKLNKLSLGKKIYEFTSELFTWCKTPSQHDSSKFPNPRECPIIVIYGDFLTSKRSKNFIANILSNSGLYKWMKENVKSYIFILDRNGNIDYSTGTSNLLAFRNAVKNMCHEQDFVSLNFFYKTNFVNDTFVDGTVEDFKNMLLTNMEKANFNEFDSTGYDSVIDEPEPETIPSSGSNSIQIQQFHGSLPEWYSNGIASSTEWDLQSMPLDFDLISTPDTTFVLVGGYDERNPDHPPMQAIDGMYSILSQYSDHNVKITGRACLAGGYKNHFFEGKKYRYFIFFEFSHGAPKIITIGISYNEIWNTFKEMSSRQRIFGIFDSCDSGSMIVQASRKMLLKSSEDKLDVVSYIIQKFERRDQLLRSMFNISAADVGVNPKMILYSSTTAENYGWYSPMSDTLYGKAFRNTYDKNKLIRFKGFFPLVQKAGIGDQGCVPQEAVYPTKDEKGSFYYNKVFL